MDDNPYRPPELTHDPSPPQLEETFPLATLGQRLAASVLDSVVIYIPLVALSLWAPIPWLADLWNDESPLGEAIFTLGSLLFFLILNGQMIHSRDQTIGKAALGIKVTDLNGQSPSTFAQFGLRYIFFYLIAAVPSIGSIIIFIDVLFIFGRQRRCLHDQLAGTRVVRCKPLPQSEKFPTTPNPISIRSQSSTAQPPANP